VTVTLVLHSLSGSVPVESIQAAIDEMLVELPAFRSTGVTVRTSTLKVLHPELARCFDQECARLHDVAGEVTAEALSYAAWAARDPTNLQCAKDMVASLHLAAADVLVTSLDRIAAVATEQPVALPGLVLGVKSARREIWGETVDVYPKAVSTVAVDVRELIQHEVLHQFAVSEGYDTSSHAVLPGCGRCIMQFEPNRGDGLCTRHQEELRRFLAQWASTQTNGTQS